MLSLFALIVLILTIVIMVFITQLLWNFVMPDVFGLKEIEFWQTFALLILSGIFFGSHCYASNPSTVNTILV